NNILRKIYGDSQISRSLQLENDFSRMKSFEQMAKKNEEELQAIGENLNAIKNQFSEEQRSEFNSFQKMGIDLGKECQALENEIALWRNKKSEIEEKTSKEGSLLKMEMVQSVGKLRHLDKQKNELLSSDNSEESERGHLLAQVKRD